VSSAGEDVGTVDAVELVTIGQRRGLGLAGDGSPRYALDVDVEHATVTVGHAEELMVAGESLRAFTWVDADSLDLVRAGAQVEAQVSAHGAPIQVAAVAFAPEAPEGAEISLAWAESQRRIAPGQSIVLYDGDYVLGGGIVRRPG
jgi:tRNA-specific 2-thiouridylase